jgi:hypothetical protein
MLIQLDGDDGTLAFDGATCTSSFKANVVDPVKRVLGTRSVPVEAVSRVEIEPPKALSAGKLRLLPRPGADPVADVAGDQLKDSAHPLTVKFSKRHADTADALANAVREAVAALGVADTPAERPLVSPPGPPLEVKGLDGSALFDGTRLTFSWGKGTAAPKKAQGDERSFPLWAIEHLEWKDPRGLKGHLRVRLAGDHSPPGATLTDPNVLSLGATAAGQSLLLAAAVTYALAGVERRPSRDLLAPGAAPAGPAWRATPEVPADHEVLREVGEPVATVSEDDPLARAAAEQAKAFLDARLLKPARSNRGIPKFLESVADGEEMREATSAKLGKELVVCLATDRRLVVAGRDTFLALPYDRISGAEADEPGRSLHESVRVRVAVQGAEDLTLTHFVGGHAERLAAVLRDGGAGPAPDLGEATAERADVTAAVAASGAWTFGVKRELRRLPSLLAADEEVRAIDRGFYEDHLGLVVLTTRRVFFFESGWFESKAEDFPLTAITSVEVETGIVVDEITIRVAGGSARLRHLQDARRFAEAVRAELEAVRTRHVREQADAHAAALAEALGRAGQSAPAASPTTQESILDQLKKLAELRNAGVLTEDEFAAKKAALLARL